MPILVLTENRAEARELGSALGCDDVIGPLGALDELLAGRNAIMPLRGMKTGWNVPENTTVLFSSRAISSTRYEPAIMEQAISRAHRMGDIRKAARNAP